MNKFLVVLSVVSIFFFTSCENENAVNPQPTGKATIRGVIYANLDEDDAQDKKLYEAVPSVPVYLVTYYGNYEKVQEVTTGTDGSYAFEIEVASTPIDVAVYVADFIADVKVDTGNDDAQGNPIYETKKGTYTAAEGVDERVVKGETLIRDIIISQPAY